MRTITNLYTEGDIVFIRVKNKAIVKRFFHDALEEGFLINGSKIIKESFLKYGVFRLERSNRIHAISGFVTHIYYGSLCKVNDGKSVVRIDYEKYVDSCNDYYITRREDL